MLQDLQVDTGHDHNDDGLVTIDMVVIFFYKISHSQPIRPELDRQA